MGVSVLNDALLAVVAGSSSTTLCTGTIVYEVCDEYPVPDGQGGVTYVEQCHEEYGYIVYECGR